MTCRDPEKVREYQRAYRERNREKIRAVNLARYHETRDASRARNNDWYRRNRDAVLAKRKSAEARATRAESRNNREQDPTRRKSARELQRIARATDPLRFLVAGARRRSKQAGLPFDLDHRLLTIPDLCPLLGVPMVRGTPYTPSLDRIDPTKGYVRGNVWVVSRRANVIKNDATLAELELIARNLRKVTP